MNRSARVRIHIRAMLDMLIIIIFFGGRVWVRAPFVVALFIGVAFEFASVGVPNGVFGCRGSALHVDAGGGRVCLRGFGGEPRVFCLGVLFGFDGVEDGDCRGGNEEEALECY